MSNTNVLTNYTKMKQLTDRDSRQFGPLVADQEVQTSTANQQIINLTQIVCNLDYKSSVQVYVDGKLLTEGASNDYTWTNVQSNLSSQITLAAPIQANLNIQIIRVGVTQQSLPNASSVTAQLNEIATRDVTNYVINGAMDFWQRSISSVNLSTTFAYQSVDRFLNRYTGTVTGTPTIIRSTDVPVNKQFQYSASYGLRRNGTAATIEMQHRIESINAKALDSRVISVGVWYKTTVATTLTLTLNKPTVSDNYTSTTLASTVTVNITPDGTWRQAKFENLSVVDPSLGLALVFSMNLPSGTDGTILSHLMTGVQLNFGTALVTNFTRAGGSIGGELQLSQRYYEKSFELDINPAMLIAKGVQGTLIAFNGSAQGGCIYFLTRKRISPTIAFYNTQIATANTVYFTNTGNVSSAASVGGFASTTIGFLYNAQINSNGTAIFNFTADAEI